MGLVEQQHLVLVLELVEQRHLVLELILAGQRLVVLVLILVGQRLVVLVLVEHFVLVLLVEAELLVLDWELVCKRLAVQVELFLVEPVFLVQLAFLPLSVLCSQSNLVFAMLVVQVQFVPWLASLCW